MRGNRNGSIPDSDNARGYTTLNCTYVRGRRATEFSRSHDNVEITGCKDARRNRIKDEERPVDDEFSGKRRRMTCRRNGASVDSDDVSSLNIFCDKVILDNYSLDGK